MGKYKTWRKFAKKTDTQRTKLKEQMKDKIRSSTENKTEQPSRGIEVIHNIPKITPLSNKIAREYSLKVATKSGTRVKDLTAKAEIPFGDKN